MSAHKKMAQIFGYLDQISRRMKRLERDLGISVETQAIFVRFWLATTPALPEPATQVSRATVRERFGGFIAALGRRLAKGAKAATGDTR